METSFRQLAVNEMELLEKLLAHEFLGRDALRQQLGSLLKMSDELRRAVILPPVELQLQNPRRYPSRY
jgi:hypothetical protein